MDDTRISALAVLKETVTLMVREWRLFFILTASLSVLTVVFFWPVLDLYAEFLAPEVSAGAIDEETSGLILDRITYLAFLIWPYLFLTYGALVIWSRAAIGGATIAFDGGLQALLLRTARAFWRLFCGLGWVLLIGLGTFIVILFLLALLAIAGVVSVNPDAVGEVPPLVMALLFPMFVVVFVAVGLVTMLISVSIHAESREISLPIHHCFRLMKGNRISAGGTFFLVGLLYEIFFTVISVALVGTFSTGPLWLFIPGFFFLFIFGMAIQLVWISYGAVYAILLVPEIKS